MVFSKAFFPLVAHKIFSLPIGRPQYFLSSHWSAAIIIFFPLAVYFFLQGFWPDGVYTAPTAEALKWDILTTKSLGYNMIRSTSRSAITVCGQLL